jgi:arsenate reductase (thioredoxin)
MTEQQQRDILFVCAENAGRSQMAQAFAEKLGMRAMSAGTVPAGRVNPFVVEAMKEKGIDISRYKTKMLTPNMVNSAGLVVTMGCSVESACPRPMLAEMQKKLIDWELKDPKGKSIHQVRSIRDEIERKVLELSKNQPSLVTTF